MSAEIKGPSWINTTLRMHGMVLYRSGGDDESAPRWMQYYHYVVTRYGQRVTLVSRRLRKMSRRRFKIALVRESRPCADSGFQVTVNNSPLEIKQ